MNKTLFFDAWVNQETDYLVSTMKTQPRDLFAFKVWLKADLDSCTGTADKLFIAPSDWNLTSGIPLLYTHE